MSEPNTPDQVTEEKTDEGLTLTRRKKIQKPKSDSFIKTLKNKRTLSNALRGLDKQTRDSILGCITDVCAEVDLEEQIAEEELQKKTQIVKEATANLAEKGLSKDEILSIIQNM